MTTLIYTLPTRSSDNVCDGIGTLSSLAGSHAATSQELDLVAVTVSIGNGLPYLSGCDFFAATNNGAIIHHTEQLAGNMKKGLQERTDMQFLTHPFPVAASQAVAFTPIYPTQFM